MAMRLMLKTHHLIKSLSSIPIFRQPCRKITSSSSSSSIINNDSILVKRVCHETGEHYFSAFSTKNWALLPDFRSPYFERSGGVSGICDGVVLLYGGMDDDLLWKPSTNEFKLLPPSHVVRHPQTAWNHCDCTGLGFDSKSGDYKVVRFVTNYFETEEGYYDGCHKQVELYSFKSESWKLILEGLQKCNSDVLHPTGGTTVYVNGCCYWSAADSSILSLDFAQESFHRLSYPTTGKFQFPTGVLNGCFMLSGVEYIPTLVEFDGSLGVVIYPRLGNEKSFELWVLNKEGLWSREFEIRVVGADEPLRFSGDGQLLFLKGSEGLLLYDFRVHQLKKIDHIHFSDHEIRYMQVIPYL